MQLRQLQRRQPPPRRSEASVGLSRAITAHTTATAAATTHATTITTVTGAARTPRSRLLPQQQC